MTTGILIGLVLGMVQEDLGDPYRDSQNGFRLRPPATWIVRQGKGSLLLSMTPPKGSAFIRLLGFPSPHPTPLSRFRSELKSYLAQEFPKYKVLFERDRTLGGRPSFQIAVRATVGQDSIVAVRAAIHRTHLLYYMFDFRCRAEDYDKYYPAFVKTTASFEIYTPEYTLEERAAHARAMKLLRAGKLGRKELEGESWQGIFLAKSKIGYQHETLRGATVEGRPGFTLEVEKVLDFQGKRAKHDLRVRCTFTADGSYQRLESEENLSPEKGDPLRLRVKATLRGESVVVWRSINEVQEEKRIRLPAGTLLLHVADVFRRSLVRESPGDYLVPTFHPFSDEPGQEWMENMGRDRVRMGPNVHREIVVILSKVDREGSITYKYDVDGRLGVASRSGSSLAIVALTKEQALKRE